MFGTETTFAASPDPPDPLESIRAESLIAARSDMTIDSSSPDDTLADSALTPSENRPSVIDARFTDLSMTLPADPSEKEPFAEETDEVTRGLPTALSGRNLPEIPGYEMLGELGRGGMGVVYLARQNQLNRLCAVKMILTAVHAGRESASRFLVEAETVARMRHPNIVQVYHLGEHDGQPYLALEYVEGGSLAQALNGTPWPARQASRLVEVLARAIAEAHHQGVVHRDLKPGNILLGAGGTPKITDFGLAKSLGADSNLTQSGAIMGSPSYMAPEQAEGGAKKVDVSVDIYALGAILYELLTGRPPFRGATVLETLEQVKNTEPVAPSRLVPGLPRDLETIVLKCLQKDSIRRYGTAMLLADDLRRFQEGETIVARPVGPLERAGRWCLRNKALAGAMGTAAAALVAVATVALFDAGRQRHFAVEQTRATREIAGLADRLNSALVESNRRLAIRNYERGQTFFDKDQTGPGLLWMLESWHSAIDAHDPSWQRAARANLSAWLPHHPRIKAVFSHTAPVVSTACRSDGKVVLTGSEDHTARLWDASTGQPVSSPLPHPGPVTGVAFSPDGTMFATASSDGIRLWRTTPSGLIASPLAPPVGAHAVVFSPDGSLLAAGCSDGTVRRWELATARPIGQPLVHGESVHCVAFSPNGRSILSGGDDKTARLWNAATGQPTGKPLIHDESVMCLSFSPSGKVFITGSNDGKAQLWDAETQTPLGAPLLHDAAVRVALFHHDGKIILTGNVDKSVRLWDASTRLALEPRLPHQGPVEAGAFCPDGKSVLSGGGDYTVRLWDVELETHTVVRLEHQGPVTAVAYSPNGKVLLTASWDKTARLWDATTGMPLARPLTHPHQVWAAAFSPDGHLVLTGCADKVPRLWNADTGALVRALLPHGGPVSVVGFSSDARTLVTGGQDSTVRLWDSATGQPVGEPFVMPGDVDALAFSPDGRTFLTGRSVGTAHLCDLTTCAIIGNPIAHPGAVSGVSFSPNGRSVLIGGEDGTARLWDLTTRKLLTPPLHHQAWVFAVAFSPDGRTILTGSWDKTARLWDAAAGVPLGPPIPLPDKVGAVAFGPDGKTIVVGCWDKTAKVFRLPSELPDDFDRVAVQVKVLTGLELDDQASVRVLDNQAWLDQRDWLERLVSQPSAGQQDNPTGP